MGLKIICKGAMLISSLIFISYKVYRLTNTKTLLTAFNVWNDELQNPISLVSDNQEGIKKAEEYKKEMNRISSIDPNHLKNICSRIIGTNFEFQKFKGFVRGCVKETEEKKKVEEKLKNFIYR